MITVKIDELVLLEAFMTRAERWIDDPIKEDLLRDYYKGLVYSGCFEGGTLDIAAIVDDDIINNTAFIHKKDFEQWDIESEVDDSIVAYNEEEDLYLIRTY